MMEEEHESFQKLSRQSQEIQSSRQNRVTGKLKQPLNHTSNILHTQIIRDPIYRSAFGVKERFSNWMVSCIKCANTEQSFINLLEEAERKTPASLSEEFKKLLNDKILKLKVIDTSRLQLDPNVMHPFVKVHIVDKNTGCYIRNLEKTEDPVIYHREEITSYNKIDRKYQASQNDLILPFATNCCDFRQLGNSKGQWNQKFYINYPAHLLLNPDTIFLFEILDFNHQALVYRNTEDVFDAQNFYRVAWSFLRPVGMNKTYLGKEKLQLYRYKYNTKQNEGLFGKSFIPNVYYDFIWNNHEKYEGYLTVQLNYCSRPKYKFIGDDIDCPRFLFEEEQVDKKYLDRYASAELMKSQDEEKIKTHQQLLKFYRNRQICQIPKELIYKLQSSKLGCYRVKFIGNYLFTACSNKKSTEIRVFSLEDGSISMTLRGHQGVIYCMTTTPNNKYLVTTGSDHIARTWAIPEQTGQYIDEDESESYIVGQCIHTGAVYSAALIHYPIQDTLFILTCCFDGYLRLWENNLKDKTTLNSKQININDYKRSSKKVYPTSCVAADGSYFLVGDSLGDIRIYDFSKDRFSLRCLLSPEQLQNDSVLSIHILNKNHLIIQASDNLIRHFQLLGNKLRMSQSYAGANFENQIITCSVSPDNKYLLCPSETGKPYLWDIFTGTQIPLDHFNLHIKGKLVSCDWHPKYNLVALSGFVQYCPIFVYGNVLSESQIKLVAAQII